MQSADTRRQVACRIAPDYLLNMKLLASSSSSDLHGTTSVDTHRKCNDPSKFWHAFRAANRPPCGWTAGNESQTGRKFERTVAQRITITLPSRHRASSNAYPSYLPSRTPRLSECRAYARKPKSSGLVTRGRTTGLPARYQTDPAVFLTWQDLAAVYDALTFADAQETPLTAFLTINWRTAPGFNGDDGASWSHHHTRVFEFMTKWLKPRGVPVAFAYVRERCKGPGAHTHVLLHMPREHWGVLAAALEHHLHKAGGFTETSAVHVRRSSTLGMFRQTQRLGVLQYLSKGINPAELIPGSDGVLLSTFLGINPKPQVVIPCKRVGWSENVGPGARKEAGYADTDDVLRLAASLPS